MEEHIDLTQLNFQAIQNIENKTLFEKVDLVEKYLHHEIEQKHFFFRRRTTTGSSPVVTIIDAYTQEERELIYLASNDYLNLTKHPKTIEAGEKALQKYGAGAGSVPVLGGSLDIHFELEEKVAAFKGCEDSMIYTSGFGCNCGSLLALLGKNDLAVLDLYVHASIIDGCKNTNIRHFNHNDMAYLERVLKKNHQKYSTLFVIVDGVYSMDGDIAHLKDIVALAKQYGAYVMVDEAHATGVIGRNGRGTPEYWDVEGQVDVVSGTFSKAIGAVGGFIAGKKKLIDYLRIYSRSYMFSTAMAPQATASAIAALDLIQEEEGPRQALWKNIHYFRDNLLKLNFNIGQAETAIFPIIIGNDNKTKEVCKFLHENGVYANYVLYPAVPASLSRIRMSLMSTHTQAHLDRTLELLEHIGKKLAIIA